MIGDKMSEQMTSRDIEDVLQSIRRLVTEDLRPSPRDDRAGARLILTPALRVVDGQPAPEPAPPPAAPAEPRVDLVLAALDRAVRADPPPQWEAETGDPAPPLRLETPVHAPVPPRAATAAPVAQPEPELFLDDAEARDVAATVLPGEDAGAVVEDISDMAAPEPARPDPATVQRDPDWSAAAEAAARAELEDAPVLEQMPRHDTSMDDAGDGAWLDEEALREIVRAVLREELSGPLGERITRNIRKLVHAEIARALSVRDSL